MPVGGHRIKTAGPATTTNSSPSSILAVCCASSTSLSSTSSGGGGGGYGYRNMSHHYHHHQPTAVMARSAEKDLFLSHSSRLLLDIHGQPIVTRSKSMSTGSSLQQPDSYLTVMVPPPPPPPQQQQAKTLESAMKSCVRSLRERVHKPTSSIAPTTTAGSDNAGFESSRRRPSATTDQQQQQQQSTEEQPSSSSRSKLANLPVVSCASASTPSKPDGT